MKHVILSILLTVFCSSVAWAADVKIENNITIEEDTIFQKSKDRCSGKATEIDVGFDICSENFTVLSIDRLTSGQMLDNELLESATSFRSSITQSERESTSIISIIIDAVKVVGFILFALFGTKALFSLIFHLKNHGVKDLWNQLSSKQTVNMLYTGLFLTNQGKIFTALIILWLGLADSIYSFAFKISVSPEPLSIETEETKSLKVADDYVSNLVAANRAVNDTRISLLDKNLTQLSDLHSGEPLSETLEKFNEEVKFEWKVDVVSRKNMDLRWNLLKAVQSYEFPNKVFLVNKQNSDNNKYGYVTKIPVMEFFADNSILKDLESTLEDKSVNDGAIYSALSKSMKDAASGFDIQDYFLQYYQAIATELKEDRYSDANVYEAPTKAIAEYAYTTLENVSNEINFEVENKKDVITLIGSAAKKLADSVKGHNTLLTIQNINQIAKSIAIDEKIAQCSTDYEMYDSARSSIAKIDYNSSVHTNLRNNAFAFNECVVLGADSRLSVVGFDSKKEPQRLLELEVQIEAKKLALQRVIAAVNAGYQNAADLITNSEANKANSINEESQAQIINRAVAGGPITSAMYSNEAVTMLVSRMRAQDAMNGDIALVYNGRTDTDAAYVISDIIFKKAEENEYTEVQKQLLEKYSNSYANYTYTKHNSADFRDLTSVKNSVHSSRDSLFAGIESAIFDNSPWKMAMGFNENESFQKNLARCMKDKNCHSGNIDIITFISLTGWSVAESSAKIIILSEVVDVAAGFLDTVGDAVKGEASNSWIAKQIGNGIKLVGGVGKALLSAVSAGLQVLKAIAYVALPIALFCAVFIPLTPFFLMLITTIYYIILVIFQFLITYLELPLISQNEDFSKVKHFMRYNANISMLFFATLVMIFMVFVVNVKLPLGWLLLRMAESIAFGFLGLLLFFATSMMTAFFVGKILCSKYFELVDALPKSFGGDGMRYDASAVQTGIVLAKGAELVQNVKQATNKATYSLKEFVKNRNAKPEDKENMNFKHNGNSEQK